ncbi:MAG: D-alanyl-D-alanine carboxypeptidase family protein [Clostridia bacterium]|nr:D-alanyl-D-alanine carboxypeptidase family protein [Clostridia bacterium]
MKKKKKKKPNPLIRIGVGLLAITLIVALSAAMTALLPKPESMPASAVAEPTAIPMPSPEPTITPTPAIYAPFGAQYGHGGADLIPETPTPKPTAVPTKTPTPEPTEQPTPTAKTYTTLRKGSTGPSVKALQEALRELGYLSDKADGNFGSNTQSAVIQFQAVNGLAADGLAGSQTQTLLFSGNALPASEAPKMDYLMLVNRENKLDKHFAPTDLVKIENVIPSSVLKVKYKGMQADRTATEALGRMLEDAIEDGVSNWQISSAYRTHAEQQALVDQSVNSYKKNNPSWSKARCLSATYQTVAPTGTSEHQTGLAFDITVPGVSFTGTPQQKWLHEHCYEYGFIVRFTEDKQSKTGFLAESWHFRYVGVEAAQVMTYNNWCLEEYIENMGL